MSTHTYVRVGSGLAIRMHKAGAAWAEKHDKKWNEERQKWVFLYTDGRTDTSKEMHAHEMLALCERLETEAGIEHDLSEYVPDEIPDVPDDPEFFFLPPLPPNPNIGAA